MEQLSSRIHKINACFVCIISSIFLALIVSPVFAVNLTDCRVINASGIYNLTENITSTSAKCFEVTTRDVTLDCQGNIISGIDNYDSVGVYANNDNFIIKNCIIINWYIGVKKEGSNNGVIRDSNIISNSRGISIANSENNKIFNSMIIENDQGIYISFSERNTFYNNLFNNTNNVVSLGANRNLWNTTKQSGTKIYSSGSYIGGNYWSDLISSYSDNCNDGNKDGFCDAPYTLDNENTDYLALSNGYAPDTTIPTVKIDYPETNEILNSTNISITVTANDLVYAYTNVSVLQGSTVLKSTTSSQNGTFTVYLKVDRGGYYNITATAYDLDGNSNSETSKNILTPLEISSCGAILDVPGEKYLVDRDISYNGGSICINIQADDIVLDCQGRTLWGRDATYKTYGLSLNNRKNVTIKNCGISGWTYGIFLQSSSGNTINRCIVTKSNDTGIYLYSSLSNLIYENSIGNSTRYGMRLYSGADNRIYNNLFDNKANILFEGDILKNYWNTERKIGSRPDKKGREIGGNFWTGSLNDFSKSCLDKNTDGFCDESYDVESFTNNPPQGNFILDLTGGFLSGISGLLIKSGSSSNIDYLPLSDDFVPDKTPPSTSLTVRLPGGSILNLSEWTREKYVNVTLNCSDNGSGCLKTLYCYDEYGNCTPWKVYKGSFLIEFEKNQTRTFYLDYMSSDSDSNNETMKVAAIRSLSNNQKVAIDSPRDLSYFKSGNISVMVRVLKTDELNYTELLIRNSSGEIVNSTLSSTASFTKNIELPEEGTYTITAMFHSNYNVTSNESSITVKFDNTPPAITLFNLVPSGRVLLGNKLTGSCTANDNDRGVFQGEVSGLDSTSVGTKTATCTATDFAGNSVTDTKTYEVYAINCEPGAKRCNSNNIEACIDNSYEITDNCDYMCAMKNGVPTCIDDPNKNNDPEEDVNTTPEDETNKTSIENSILSNPTLVAAGSLLLILVVGVMIFLYSKIFQKSKKDFSKRMAIIEAKMREAESKGKDTSSVRSEFGLAEADISMGLVEMAEPRLKEIEKNLKKLK